MSKRNENKDSNVKSSLCREQNTYNTRFKQRNKKENHQNDNLERNFVWERNMDH